MLSSGQANHHPKLLHTFSSSSSEASDICSLFSISKNALTSGLWSLTQDKQVNKNILTAAGDSQHSTTFNLNKHKARLNKSEQLILIKLASDINI